MKDWRVGMSGSNRLLIVDDDQSLLAALTMPLRAYFSVVTANSYEQAQAIMRQNVFDIMLIDCGLGEFSGLDLIGLGLRTSPGGIILMFSGEAEINRVLLAIDLGASDYIVKDERLLQELLIRIPIALRRNENSRGLGGNESLSGLPERFSDLNEQHYQEFLRSNERRYLDRALALSHFEVSALSKVLGLSRSTVHNKLNELKISRKPMNGNEDLSAEVN